MALFEHLKKLFGDKAMTADEFEAAYKAQESSKDGVKLANLTEGGYVSDQKFKAKEAELAAAQQTITGLQDTVKKFDGVDVEKLKTAAATAQKKFEDDLAATRKDSAIQIALVAAKARNVKAVKALLDDSKITLNADGTLSGLDVKELQKTVPYLFEIETKQDEGGGHDGGKPDDKKPGKSYEDEIREQLYGKAAK